ncbi:MAG: YHYH protein [Candidatus Kaiserbacteria bacterium]|nr:YHYH protein [Candidatus Kaiserbacteria bacterium]
MAGSVNMAALPLGDYKYVTTGPKKGYVYICHVATGGQGAMVNGPWIHGTTWDETTKVQVQGHISWPSASNSFNALGTMLKITSNDLPTEGTTGVFPIAQDDPAHQYDGNRSSITAQNESYSLPANPTMLSTPDCIYGQVGIMTNGVSLYDGFDATYRDAAAHEEQDSCNGHPNDHGYHYHNLTSCIKNIDETNVVGWAFDGFPITGPKVAAGKYLSTDDLDECHGLTSTITINGKSVTTYHYVMTYDFPYSVSCFRGKSYEPKPGGGQGQGNQTPTPQGGARAGGPPPEAISACAGKTQGASCSFSAPMGTITGHCDTPPGSSLACVPAR